MFPIAIDDNLSIHLFTRHHAQQLFTTLEQNRDFLVARLPWADSTRTLADCKNFLLACEYEFAHNLSITPGVFNKQGELVAAISLRDYDWTKSSAEMGYWVVEKHQGQGIVTRACKFLLVYAFDILQFNSVTAICAIDNPKSQAIPKRLGFNQETILPNEIWLYDHAVDGVLFRLLASDWRAKLAKQASCLL